MILYVLDFPRRCIFDKREPQLSTVIQALWIDLFQVSKNTYNMPVTWHPRFTRLSPHRAHGPVLEESGQGGEEVGLSRVGDLDPRGRGFCLLEAAAIGWC